MNDFTQGKIFKPLFWFIVPILGALFLQSFYGAVDLIVVGQFAKVADVSGVSTGSQITYIPMMLISGLATATTVLIGQKIGEKSMDDAGKVVGSAISLFGTISVVLSAIMIIFSKQVCMLMHTPLEAFHETQRYVIICSLGTVFITAYNVLGALFRGLGDSKTPLFSVIIATVANIFGDLFFVAVLDMGSSGAAIATVLAQTLSVILCILKIKGSLPFKFKRNYIRYNMEYIKRIFELGLPIALQSFLVNISFLVILSIVNSLGVVASAGVGVAEKLCNFIMLVPAAFSQGVGSFVAQNYGARQIDRAKKGVFICIIVSETISILIAFMSFFYGDMLCRLFANDTAVIYEGFLYLKAYAIDTLLVSFIFCLNGLFNGCGKTKIVMVLNVLCAVFRMCASYIFSRIEPVSLFRVGLANPIASAIQIIMFIFAFIYVFRKHSDELYVN